MFLHLGNGISVRTNARIMINCYDLFKNEAGQKFLDSGKKQGKLVNTLAIGSKSSADELIKSIIVTDKKIYLSAISPLTLMRRSRRGFYTLDSDKNDLE